MNTPMTAEEALALLMALPPKERLALGQQLTHSAIAAGAEPNDETFDDGTLSEEDKAELSAIVEAIDTGTMKMYTLDEVEQHLAERRLALASK